MRGHEERQALADLRWLRQVVDQLSDRVILNALARDAESVIKSDGVNQEIRDTVHESLVKMCHHLREAANHMDWTVGTLTVLSRVEPTGERVQSVPDCLACGELAVPRPKSGFCENCYRKWLRFRSAGHGDRDAFIRQEQIGVGDAGDTDSLGALGDKEVVL